MSRIDFAAAITADEKARQAEALARTRQRTAARAYLDATDWFVTRFVETGKPVPDDISQERGAARQILSTLTDEDPIATPEA